MRLKYIGESFGDLTNGKTYECLGEEGPFFRVVDDSGEDYLYSKTRPAQLDNPKIGGRWEIVEE